MAWKHVGSVVAVLIQCHVVSRPDVERFHNMDGNDDMDVDDMLAEAIAEAPTTPDIASGPAEEILAENRESVQSKRQAVGLRLTHHTNRINSSKVQVVVMLVIMTSMVVSR